MEVVLGIDNLIFISILSHKLPEEHRARTRPRAMSMRPWPFRQRSKRSTFWPGVAKRKGWRPYYPENRRAPATIDAGSRRPF
ncbi:hypothetical protein [Sphingobium indicum]|uniref:hypothetical protein n=1 Tax=Sphingobium indicum TaxID=332055 RepID=UPI0039944B6C